MTPKSTSSPSSRADERVIVFIDGSNLYHVLSEVCGRHDVQFGKLSEKLANGRDLRRTYYYNIRQHSERYPETGPEQEKFLHALYDTPYLEVRLGISKQRGEAMVEKGVDVMIAIDLVKNAYADLYDTAILVSGDGDFFPAIQAVKDLGKHVEVAAFKSNLSAEASRSADLHLNLTKTYFTGLWMTRSGAALARTAANEPEVMDEASSPEGENKQPRTPRRRVASRTSEKATVKDEAPAKEPAKTTRRRRGGQRTRPAEAPAAPVGAGTPQPWQAPPPQPAVPADAPDRGGAPLRRTPVRRRIGGSAPSDNGAQSADSPKPPALRNGGASEGGKDAPNEADSPAERRGPWLRRLGLGGDGKSD